MLPALQWKGRGLLMAMRTQAGESSSCPLVPVFSVGSRQAQPLSQSLEESGGFCTVSTMPDPPGESSYVKHLENRMTELTQGSPSHIEV